MAVLTALVVVATVVVTGDRHDVEDRVAAEGGGAAGLPDSAVLPNSAGLPDSAGLPEPTEPAGPARASQASQTGQEGQAGQAGQVGGGTAPPAMTVTDVTEVARLTGAGSVNATEERWNVAGTDLGHTFLHRGELYMVFGDTFGPERSAWRSNALARIVSSDPRDGLRFASMVTNDAAGSSDSGDAWHAAEILGSRKIDGFEKTVIPTAGISLGDRMVLHYMSVRRWGPPGVWYLNGSGLAFSDDDGVTWEKHPDVWWPTAAGFGQVAMVRDGGFVHLFGIPGGRFGEARLARVEVEAIFDLAAYEYWDGAAWRADRSAAVAVVPAPVGELSVRWSERLRRWLMLYLNEERGAIVLRTAEALTGPWSGEQVVTTADEHPQLYAPYLVPGGHTGDDVYFTMSRYGPYQVFLMRMSVG